jgi:hypothetical protein
MRVWISHNHPLEYAPTQIDDIADRCMFAEYL